MMTIRIEEVENGYIINDLTGCYSGAGSQGIVGKQYVADNISALKVVIHQIAISNLKDDM